MTLPSEPIVDPLASFASADVQKNAARMAQDIFTGIFRHLAEGHADFNSEAADTIRSRCQRWCQAGGSEEGQALRIALLISGLDQWGLAFSQGFAITAIPALSELIGTLRTGLAPQADARFQAYFSQIREQETAAIDFKIELRRSIHLALWHALAACDQSSAADPLIQTLGSLLLALARDLPNLGWRLIADTLTGIQASLLSDQTSTIAQDSARKLFTALQHALPADCYRNILATSAQAVRAWQQAQRSSH